MPFSIHPNGICESKNVGEGTKVWAFAHILQGAAIGRDCNICDHTFIENDVVIGDRVTIKCGVQLWDGVCVEDDVFIGPNATFTNDRFPRSKVYPEKFSRTVVQKGASIGANATILPGITIGQNAMIGAGSVVTRSVPPNAVVAGNPARIVRYHDSPTHINVPPPSSGLIQESDASGMLKQSRVTGVTLHKLSLAKDIRGTLAVGEFLHNVPFEPKRYFIVFDVPSTQVRGEHAHRLCKQFLVCVAGTCSVMVDDGEAREEFLLDRPTLGIYLPPMTWGVQYKYSKDAVLLVFASDYYDPADYIRDYREFLDSKRQQQANRIHPGRGF